MAPFLLAAPTLAPEPPGQPVVKTATCRSRPAPTAAPLGGAGALASFLSVAGRWGFSPVCLG